MHRDDILPNEILFDAHGILVYRAQGTLHVQIANASLEDLTVLQSDITHCQISGNYAHHAYMSGNRTGTTYALSNVLESTHLAYNSVRSPVTWGAFRHDPKVRIGIGLA